MLPSSLRKDQPVQSHVSRSPSRTPEVLNFGSDAVKLLRVLYGNLVAHLSFSNWPARSMAKS
jgi:hypothetical protein